MDISLQTLMGLLSTIFLPRSNVSLKQEKACVNSAADRCILRY